MMNKLFTLFLCASVLISCSKDDGPTVEQCSKPTNLQVTNITHAAATLSWEHSNPEASFTVEFGTAGFAPGSGTLLNTSETSLSLSSLNAETTYDFYITANCGNSNLSLPTNLTQFTTLQPPVVAEFRPQLSELNIYTGNLSNLEPGNYAFEYQLATPLFTDYAYKQRLIALPQGSSLTYQDDGLPVFPDNTVITKTFYYNIDDRDESLGKIILETRVLIKTNGEWTTGNYKWNEAQTDATLTLDGHEVPVSYTDADGETVDLAYEIPSNTDCFTCHSNNNEVIPIGPKVRTLNSNGQLQHMIDTNLISNIASENDAEALPNWEDSTNFTLEQRARAYFDVNCAHCHQPGGSCENESSLDFRYETRFDDTFIFDFKESIFARMSSYFVPEYGMPLIGTTVLHEEGFALINAYINTL